MGFAARSCRRLARVVVGFAARSCKSKVVVKLFDSVVVGSAWGAGTALAHCAASSTATKVSVRRSILDEAWMMR